MLYIHYTSCISSQNTFPEANLAVVNEPIDNKLLVKEPAYDEIPKGVLRRMSKPVRIGIGAALPLLKNIDMPAGIIIGTANAGMEDCFYFLQQINQYNEGLLTPGNFVQSTPNALAAQVGMLKHNTGYNITHVHLGLAFENALTDAAMLAEEDASKTYLLGAVDDISTYNYNISLLDGQFKEQIIPGEDIYKSNTKGCIPGEGSAMFIVNGIQEKAIVSVVANESIHTTDEMIVKEMLEQFLAKNLPGDEPLSLFISGENGDSRLNKYYETCESMLNDRTGIIHYKHLSGEYPTAAAFALWLGCFIAGKNELPSHLIKRNGTLPVKKMLLYNNFKGIQHSFILLQAL